MRNFGVMALIGLLLVALIAGGIGFAIGVGAQAAPAAVAPAGSTAVVYGWHWFGFPFFGLIFGLLFLFLIFAIIRRLVWGGRGWHGYSQAHGYGYGQGHGSGPGGRAWDGKSVPPFADEMLRSWHSQAHGQQSPTEPVQPTTKGDATPPPDLTIK